MHRVPGLFSGVRSPRASKTLLGYRRNQDPYVRRSLDRVRSGALSRVRSGAVCGCLSDGRLRAEKGRRCNRQEEAVHPLRGVCESLSRRCHLSRPHGRTFCLYSLRPLREILSSRLSRDERGCDCVRGRAGGGRRRIRIVLKSVQCALPPLPSTAGTCGRGAFSCSPASLSRGTFP